MGKNNSDTLPLSGFPSPSFQWFYPAIRFSLGLIFISSGTIKLMGPQFFSIIIDAYGLLPEAAVFTAAIVIAALEVTAGVGLLFDVHGSLETISAMLLLFMSILGYGLWLGLDVDCGCFGPDDPEAKAFHGLRQALIRDGVMMLGAVYLFFQRRRQRIQPLKLSAIYYWIYTWIYRKKDDRRTKT